MRVSSEDEEEDEVSGEAVDVANNEVAAGDAVVEDAALELTIIENSSVSCKTEFASQPGADMSQMKIARSTKMKEARNTGKQRVYYSQVVVALTPRAQ